MGPESAFVCVRELVCREGRAKGHSHRLLTHVHRASACTLNAVRPPARVTGCGDARVAPPYLTTVCVPWRNLPRTSRYVRNLTPKESRGSASGGVWRD